MRAMSTADGSCVSQTECCSVYVHDMPNFRTQRRNRVPWTPASVVRSLTDNPLVSARVAP